MSDDKFGFLKRELSWEELRLVSGGEDSASEGDGGDGGTGGGGTGGEGSDGGGGGGGEG